MDITRRSALLAGASLAVAPSAVQAQKASDTLRILFIDAVPNVDMYFNSQRTGLILAHQAWDMLVHRDPVTFEEIRDFAELDFPRPLSREVAFKILLNTETFAESRLQSGKSVQVEAFQVVLAQPDAVPTFTDLLKRRGQLMPAAILSRRNFFTGRMWVFCSPCWLPHLN